MSEKPARDYEPPIATIGSAAGVGWYSPQFLRALKKAACDPAPECLDWDAWFDCYQRTFVRLKNEGLRPYKIVIEPGDLARWLADREREHDVGAHDEFVAWKLEKLVRKLPDGERDV